MAASPSSRVHLFPVRHHSPRSSATLRAFLDAVRPELVLVEGPCDADPLIDVLVDADTEPPIAILGYATSGEPCSALWPFAAYSPEWQALRWAADHEVRARFIDVPVGMSLAHDRREGHDEPGDEPDDGPAEVVPAQAAPPAEPSEGTPPPFEPAPFFDPHQAAAEARGLRGFEELWEACFEAPTYHPEQFREALLAHAALVRDAHPVVWHRARDAFMAARIEAAIAEGTAPERIVAVLGAAHVAALVVGDVDPTLLATLPAAREAAVTVIPYSFPRLAAQLGYGAGNRAPQYYQLAHDAGCDFRHATLQALLGFAAELRSRGFSASLADTIEAYRLARALATLRDKLEPGLDEVREACVATLCQGDEGPVNAFLWRGVLGHRVGRVAERIGKNSLQEEFWREVNRRRLPRDDRPEEIALLLREPVAMETSVFLHRLRLCGVPYAAYQGTYKGKGLTDDEKADPGGPGALSRMRESWEAQWTPSTDIALVERIALGNSLQQVTDRTLAERLEAALTTGQAAAVLLDAVVTACPRVAADAMIACDRLAATDDDLPSLAHACLSLSGLVSYGTSRDALLGQGSQGTLRSLCRKTFDRAVLRVRPACVGDDDAIAPVPRALQTLHDIALAQPEVDREAWLAALRTLVEDYAIHPGPAGVATALLYLCRAIVEDDVATLVSQRLSDTLHPWAAAAYLEGFLRVNAMVLVQSRAVVETLDAWITTVDADAFRNVLPLLRRAFGSLGSTERRWFLETLVSARGLGAKAQAAMTVITTQDEAKLAEVSDDLDAALDDLDDLL